MPCLPHSPIKLGDKVARCAFFAFTPVAKLPAFTKSVPSRRIIPLRVIYGKRAGKVACGYLDSGYAIKKQSALLNNHPVHGEVKIKMLSASQDADFTVLVIKYGF